LSFIGLQTEGESSKDEKEREEGERVGWKYENVQDRAVYRGCGLGYVLVR
jgi:hypothetical protein